MPYHFTFNALNPFFALSAFTAGRFDSRNVAYTAFTAGRSESGNVALSADTAGWLDLGMIAFPAFAAGRSDLGSVAFSADIAGRSDSGSVAFPADTAGRLDSGNVTCPGSAVRYLFCRATCPAMRYRPYPVRLGSAVVYEVKALPPFIAFFKNAIYSAFAAQLGNTSHPPPTTAVFSAMRYLIPTSRGAGRTLRLVPRNLQAARTSRRQQGHYNSAPQPVAAGWSLFDRPCRATLKIIVLCHGLLSYQKAVRSRREIFIVLQSP